MKYLESIKLVQFFLFEKQDIRLQEITGIFGPNASGKSSLIDAVQIAMLGANSRLISLNAQADERTTTTRTIRSYCLGMHDETKRARDNATTYITLVWRDSVTNEPISMGVCLYASIDTEGHEVRGRYIVHGVELAMQDHLEIINNQERPRAWETFRHQLVERSKVSGVDPLFSDSERYIKATLLALRGSGGAPSFEAFKSAFRFALRMKFDKSVDHIVRNDVLEVRSTNIQKFKEVTESFKRLAQMVAQVKAKIADGEKVETEFAKAAAQSIRATTWDGLSCLAAQEESVESMNRATDEKQNAEHELELLSNEFAETGSQLEHAKNEEKNTRELRTNHAAHKENGVLQSEISKASEIETKKAADIRNGLNLICRTLKEAANASHLQNRAGEIKNEIKSIEAALPTFSELDKEKLSTLLKRPLKMASTAYGELFNAGIRISREFEEAKSNQKIIENAMLRVKDGRSRLSSDTEKLLAELRDNGLHPIPVCDLVKISDQAWQPAIEAYLGRNVEALLVESKEEKAAFSIYRSSAIYGAKIVAASKQGNMVAEHGSVAELIEGDHPAAVSYLRRRFGDMMLAFTNEEALSGQRTLTKDGMIVQGGEYDRKRPVGKGQLKIGGGDDSQKVVLANEIAQAKSQVEKLKSQQEEVERLTRALMNNTSEDAVMKFMLDACGEMHSARSAVYSLSQKLNDSADAEYVRLGMQEKKWSSRAQEFQSKVGELQLKIGGATNMLEQRVNNEKAAIENWKRSAAKTDVARSNKEYDHDYASGQWDVLLGKHGEQYQEMVAYCVRQKSEADKAMQAAITRGSKELWAFKEKYREQGSANVEDWRIEREWMAVMLARLRDTELGEFEEQMNDAYKASQETFRTDVAIALSNNFDHLRSSMDRLNHVLRTCPVFSNGERYQFVRKKRPQLERLLSFIENIATHGPGEDLFGGAGEMPEEFRQLLDEKVAPGAAGVQSPLDDYREFFEFDIDILREDSLTKVTSNIGSLSKRLGTGSGGEHRAPLYVIAGAALASAYRLDSGNSDGIRLILLDEAFNKMDTINIVATMRYLEQLGLQLFMASPGDNLGTLTAFLHRYYDILRDAENSAMMIQGHDVSEKVREMFRSDLAEFNEELVSQELAAIKASRTSAEPEAVS